MTYIRHSNLKYPARPAVSAKFLHIVAFNIPYPADYGGVIDIFYKLIALKQAGVQVILHCFEYGRQNPKELDDLCFKVHYYPRKSGVRYFFSSEPYIIRTRSSNSMPMNLLGDSFPVLFEGLHSTGVLLQCAEAKKKILVRAHNIEHRYHRELSKSEFNLFRKIFLRTESAKLRRYEKILHQADCILGISKHETEYFNHTYGNAFFIPPFHRFDEVISSPGKGEYILFHGNLSVSENSEKFLELAAKSLSKTKYAVVVAGKNPSERFRRKCARHARVRLISNPSEREMDELIRNAQVNLLHTSQATGTKLKLLHALYSGRHCLVNSKMVTGTGLDVLCAVADTTEEIIRQLDRLMVLTFDEGQIRNRKKALRELSNRTGAEKIVRLID